MEAAADSTGVDSGVSTPRSPAVYAESATWWAAAHSLAGSVVFCSQDGPLADPEGAIGDDPHADFYSTGLMVSCVDALVHMRSCPDAADSDHHAVGDKLAATAHQVITVFPAHAGLIPSKIVSKRLEMGGMGVHEE